MGFEGSGSSSQLVINLFTQLADSNKSSIDDTPMEEGR